MPPSGHHAVVVGGSMAGMLAARVLSDHFPRVTLLERDQFPEKPGPRKGLPQSHHLHILLMRGQLILEHFFPGLGEEMERAGMHRLEHPWLRHSLLYARRLGAVLFRIFSLMIGTRDLLDSIIRRRVKALDRVRLLDGVEATGLLPTSDGNGIRGVRSHSRRPGEGKEEELAAELVVDAAGGGSHLRQWLGTLGFPMPADTVINAHLGYASRMYRRPANALPDWHGLMIRATRRNTSAAGSSRRWKTSAGRSPWPAAEATIRRRRRRTYLEFARSLRTPAAV